MSLIWVNPNLCHRIFRLSVDSLLSSRLKYFEMANFHQQPSQLSFYSNWWCSLSSLLNPISLILPWQQLQISSAVCYLQQSGEFDPYENTFKSTRSGFLFENITRLPAWNIFTDFSIIGTKFGVASHAPSEWISDPFTLHIAPGHNVILSNTHLSFPIHFCVNSFSHSLSKQQWQRQL